MAKEYARTQRVADYLQRELAALIQHEVRDPRVGMVSITGVDVSRDLGHAKVYYTSMGRIPAMSERVHRGSEQGRGFLAQPAVPGQQYAQCAAAAVLF